MTLGDRIRAAYEALGLQQNEAAARCGMSPQRFGNFIRGTRNPDIQTIVKIAIGLETSADALLGINEQRLDSLKRILARLLELEGMSPDRADMIARIAASAPRIAETLDPDPGPSRDLIAAQILWQAESDRRPGK